MPECVYKNCTLKCNSIEEHCAKYATMRERININNVSNMTGKYYQHKLST